jgi:D-arabinose 1-dehydrogenase-like Zn-dependent alcohol dehydrogenase
MKPCSTLALTSSSKQQKVVINDIPKPSPAPNQFLVKIQSASLCHSDLMMEMRPDYPVTLGHEGVGHIESIGAEAENKGFKVGDAIGFDYVRRFPRNTATLS